MFQPMKYDKKKARKGKRSLKETILIIWRWHNRLLQNTGITIKLCKQVTMTKAICIYVCMCICMATYTYACIETDQFSHSVVSDSLWPHGLQHARPPCPSPTPGVTQTLSLSPHTHIHTYVVVVQSPSPFLFFCDTVDCSPSGSSVHGISQARMLEWVAFSFSRGSSWPRDWACISCSASGFFTAEQPGIPVRWINCIKCYLTEFFVCHINKHQLMTLTPRGRQYNKKMNRVC